MLIDILVDGVLSNWNKNGFLDWRKKKKEEVVRLPL